mgnify:CR=1 FL=1
MEKQTDTNLVQDPEPERYYDWMLWKLRQENTLERSRMKTMTREEMWKKTVADMQGEIHALQKTIVRLQEQISELRVKDEKDERQLELDLDAIRKEGL